MFQGTEQDKILFDCLVTMYQIALFLVISESYDADCAGALQASRTQQMWLWHAHHLCSQP